MNSMASELVFVIRDHQGPIEQTHCSISQHLLFYKLQHFDTVCQELISIGKMTFRISLKNPDTFVRSLREFFESVLYQ